MSNFRVMQGGRGFTLIELVLVIGIVMILSGLSVPVFLEYRRASNDAIAHADAKNVISILVVSHK